MRTMERRDLLRLFLITFLVGSIVLLAARVRKDFSYNIKDNLKSNKGYYPEVKVAR
jgi:hypothetical protein